MSYYADQLMPSALEIEPILPHYLDIVKAIMQESWGFT